MTRQQRRQFESRIASEGMIRGCAEEVIATIKRLMSDGKIRRICACYTTDREQTGRLGQPYSIAAKLHNSKSFGPGVTPEEAAQKEAALREQRERTGTIALYALDRPGWRTPKVCSIQSVRVYPKAGESVDVPVMVQRH